MALLALGDLLCGFAQTSIQLFIFRAIAGRSEEHTSELQSQSNLVCRLLLEKKKHFEDQSASLHDQIIESDLHAFFSEVFIKCLAHDQHIRHINLSADIQMGNGLV